MADAADLKSAGLIGREGSTPFPRTIFFCSKGFTFLLLNNITQGVKHVIIHKRRVLRCMH